jgi:uncharacterized membrane protein
MDLIFEVIIIVGFIAAIIIIRYIYDHWDELMNQQNK